MRRAIISIILVLSLLSVASTSVNAPLLNSSPINLDPTITNDMLLSDIIASGSNVSITQYLNRSFSNQLTTISNSYILPDTHESTIDLSSYQIPGWTLYKAVIDASSITAIAERELVGNSASSLVSTELQIYEHSGDLYYDQLVQGFYNFSHDGQLHNISLLYISPDYDPPTQNYAYFDIRSDYENGSTNMVSSVQLDNVGYTPTWANVTESVILDANNEYYAIMNGTTLIENIFNSYPEIQWFYEDDAGNYLTRRHNTDGDSWGGSPRPYEAIMNYTYIPWNKTSNSALQYSDPSAINLMLNGTPVTGTSWSISSLNNITSFPITTNQSVNVLYDLILYYTNDNIGSTVWSSPQSGNPIMWNVTTDLTYPAVSNIVNRGMNITTIPTDWTTTGLYLGTIPIDTYSKTGTIVECNGLSDGAWTLTSTAPNYVTGLALSDSFDSSPIISQVANNVTMDVDATISQSDGSANLSVLQSSNLIFSLEDNTIVAGAAAFQWDISSTTDGNDTHSVEVYWLSADGLEAGYMTQEIFVYHSTTLVADDTIINAHTDNNFTIGINFDEISPARGLDDIPADVTYSFDGGLNATMSNPSGGRWTQVVDTTGKSYGTYNVTVYAEGYALENQSLIISVHLTTETLALNWSWSPSNNIQYLESTNLTVSYWDLGNNGVSSATVNITFDATTYALKWDGSSGNYWIQLNGTDFLESNGTTTMVLNAWKMGYVSQYNDTISITINEEVTGIGLVVNWNPVDRNITFIETITITVDYTYNSAPINDTWDGVWVRATFSGYPLVNLTYNGVSEMWEVTLAGSDYLGGTEITIRASAEGYSLRSDGPTTLIVTEDIPTLTSSWPGDVESTDYDTNILLLITVRDSSGALVNSATLTANVFGSEFPMTFEGSGIYSVLIDPQEIRGVHVVNVTIAETGYFVTSTFLNLTVRATTVIDVVYLSSEFEQYTLTITVEFNDTFYDSPISNGTVTMTIAGVEYTLTEEDSGVYVIEIVLDFDPGPYEMAVVANGPFCNEATESPVINIDEKYHVYLSITTQGDPSLEGQRLEIIATLTYNGTQGPVRNVDIHFVVTIYYVNGTIEVRDDYDTQYDTTNNDGVASWGFEIPAGNIDKIAILAEYGRSRTNWETSLIHELSVGTNPLMLLLSFFFFEDVGRLLIASILILGVVATAYNKKIKPKKRAARQSLENQLKMFRDLESLRHFMAVYLDRGTCVFYHPFTDERIQPDLISGFIAAITSVYGEIKGDGVRGTLEEIQYHGLRLNSYSGEFVIGILILEGEMTPLLKERLQFFVELFENQYDSELTDWNGLIDCFDPEWIVSTLSSTFNYSWLFAHKFGPTQKVVKTDARILDYISAVRDDRSEFYFRDILTPLAEMLDMTEAEVLDRLLALQDKGVITPVSIQTILQRQGMGLANGEIGADSIQLEYPDLEKPAVDEPEIPVEDSPPEPVKEEEKKEELDPMDEFVKDVESILTKKKDDEKNSES